MFIKDVTCVRSIFFFFVFAFGFVLMPIFYSKFPKTFDLLLWLWIFHKRFREIVSLAFSVILNNSQSLSHNNVSCVRLAQIIANRSTLGSVLCHFQLKFVVFAIFLKEEDTTHILTLNFMCRLDKNVYDFPFIWLFLRNVTTPTTTKTTIHFWTYHNLWWTESHKFRTLYQTQTHAHRFTHTPPSSPPPPPPPSSLPLEYCPSYFPNCCVCVTPNFWWAVT